MISAESGEPGRNRTFNQQIKSLLLCQLSYGPIEELRAGRARRRTAWNRRRLATTNYTTHEPAANSGGSPNGSHTDRAMIAVR